MCRQVTCSTCRKPTWAGCGAHVEQVLGHVPKAQRCQCTAADHKAAKAAKSAAKVGAGNGGASGGGGWFRRILGGS